MSHESSGLGGWELHTHNYIDQIEPSSYLSTLKYCIRLVQCTPSRGSLSSYMYMCVLCSVSEREYLFRFLLITCVLLTGETLVTCVDCA